jgi:beta-lactamase class A
MRFFVLLSSVAAFLAAPAAAQISHGQISSAKFSHAQPSKLQQLEQRLSAMATENPGEYGIAAMDLETGKTVSVNGNQLFPMASTMKIAVAAAYLAEVDAGRRSLDETIGGVTAGTLMDAMITRSSNSATDMLIETLGGPAPVDRWLRGHGLSGIRVDRTIASF